MFAKAQVTPGDWAGNSRLLVPRTQHALGKLAKPVSPFTEFAAVYDAFTGLRHFVMEHMTTCRTTSLNLWLWISVASVP